MVRMFRALGRGLRLRCPACGQGRLFERRLRMRATCPYCEVRFARERGEFLGAVYLNASLTLTLALGGFFAFEQWFHPPFALQLLFWMAFVVACSLAFFRAARGLWTAIAYLTGGVYRDTDDEREWFNPQVRRAQGRREPWAGTDSSGGW